MKKLISLLVLFLPLMLHAQYRYYKDSSYAQPFNFLSGSVSLNNNQFWDDPNFAIPLGFTFHLFGDTTDSLFVSPDFGSGGVLTTEVSSVSTTNATGIVALGSDIQDRDTSLSGSKSPLSYSTTGASPSRIFKLEWKNAGFYNAIDNGEYNDSIHFQLWIYEGSDAIEMRFGQGNYISSNIELYDGGPGPWIGLFDSVDNAFDGKINYFLGDSIQNPLLDSFSNLSSSSFIPGMTGHPVAGTVYRFTPKGISGTVGYHIDRYELPVAIEYNANHPQVVIDIFSNGSFHYELVNIQGQLLQRGTLNKGRHHVPVEALSEGMYFLKLQSGVQQEVFRFMR